MTYLGAALLTVAAGLSLGAVYFGGLWYTVRRLPDSRHPAVLMLGSLAVRLSLCLAGFYLIARWGGWQLEALALVAFVGARLLLVRRLGAQTPALVSKKG